MAFHLPRRRGESTPPPAAYAPVHNGRPDPGEVVWAWVPYEDDPHRGKDRPVLVLAVAGGRVTGLGMTSKDHYRDDRQEARAGRVRMDVGTGDWDRQGRESEVRLNRVLSLPESQVRREGAALDPATFAEVLRAVRRYL